MRTKIILKFMLPTITLVVVVMAVLAGIAARMLESEVRERANTEAAAEADRVFDNLSTVDALSSDSVSSAMRVLTREGERLGDAEIKGTASLGGEVVPTCAWATRHRSAILLWSTASRKSLDRRQRSLQSKATAMFACPRTYSKQTVHAPWALS